MYCVVPGCTNEQTRAKGMCHGHYYRRLRILKKNIVEDSAEYKFQVYTRPLKPKGRSKYEGKACATYGCINKAEVKHVCKPCYMRDYQRKRRSIVEDKAKKYDEIMSRVAADAHEVPSGEEEAAPASRPTETPRSEPLPLPADPFLRRIIKFFPNENKNLLSHMARSDMFTKDMSDDELREALDDYREEALEEMNA